MIREHDPEDGKTGGVPAVVRDGENPLHGEGEQPDRLSLHINRSGEVKTFDNR